MPELDVKKVQVRNLAAQRNTGQMKVASKWVMGLKDKAEKKMPHLDTVKEARKASEIKISEHNT